MRKYLNPDEPGHEKKKMKIFKTPQAVDQLYCPRDGHYCEQHDCGSCMAESVGAEQWNN